MFLAHLVLIAFLPLQRPREIKVNQGWEFGQVTPGAKTIQVNLPHSPVLMTPALMGRDFVSFQGVVLYHKKFLPQPGFKGKQVMLRFDGAMQVAQCFVNGSLRLTHEGGYLPFKLDLSAELGHGREATIDVLLDNRDDPSFNPGRSQKNLDFTYAGGLYRDVWLEVTSPSHIEDVYASTGSVTAASAKLSIQTQIQNLPKHARLEIQVTDPQGHPVTHRSTPASAALSQTSLTLSHPKLWDLDHPNLYSVEVKLIQGDHKIDSVTRRIGVRKLEFDHKRGMLLNGTLIHPQGTNRHMAFPIIGNAASDEAQVREARMLKRAGMQILRLAHYPQSPAFLDACDELGILVIDPIPGWQFFQDTPHFRNHVLGDIRELVRRDRNHSSVAIFETCLNETYNVPDSFWLECGRVAHQEIGNGNYFTGGDSYGKQDYSRPIWDVPWTGWDEQTFSRPALFKMQKGIDREYGDYEFGGEESTSRADAQDGEAALMLQAWNFIWSHNRNRGNPWSFCDLTWEGIDTVRGLSQSKPVSKSGLFDLYRRPKPVADFFRSQVSATPYISIANDWTPRPSLTKVVVFSNCSEVELFLNGRSLGRQKPDSGPTTGYLGPKTADPLYWAHGSGDIVPASTVSEPVGGTPGALPFSGGNAQNLLHPPFTFQKVPYEPGALVAVGYIKGHRVSRAVKRTPGKPAKLRVRWATEGIPLKADGADFIFVYVDILDKNNQLVTGYKQPVILEATGPGEVLGPNIAIPAGGVAAFMIRSTGKPGQVQLKAKAQTL